MSEAEPEETGILSPLIGHDGAKAILRSALRRGDVDILLGGPPASGKSVALLAVEDAVDGAMYVDGRGLSERKLRDTLKQNPPLLLIDEMDNMIPDVNNALNTAMEQGRVTKNVHGDSYDVEIDTQVFGATNDIESMPDDVVDRFVPIMFEPYTREEFIEVSSVLLPKQVEWVSARDDPESTAAEIARIVWDETGTKSPRKARDAARLADCTDRVGAIVQAMNDPKADVESEPLTADDLPHNGHSEDSSPDDAHGIEIPEDPRSALPAGAVRKLENMAAERDVELTDDDYRQAYREWQRRVN